jgi:hypothetical protein
MCETSLGMGVITLLATFENFIEQNPNRIVEISPTATPTPEVDQ